MIFSFGKSSTGILQALLTFTFTKELERVQKQPQNYLRVEERELL